MESRNERLHTLLSSLHHELAQTETVDITARQELEQLMHDIRSVLERTEESAGDHDESLNERLGVAVEQFEASHPQFTTLIAQMLDTLRRTF